MKHLPFFLFLAISNLIYPQVAWHPLTSIPQSIARYDDVFFLNPELGWAADGAGSAVYKTTNGGTSWGLQVSNGGIYYRNIEFVDAESAATRVQLVSPSLLERYRTAYQRHFALWTSEGLRHRVALARVGDSGDFHAALRREALPKGAVELCG